MAAGTKWRLADFRKLLEDRKTNLKYMWAISVLRMTLRPVTHGHGLLIGKFCTYAFFAYRSKSKFCFVVTLGFEV